jgi:hypothetical protein
MIPVHSSNDHQRISGTAGEKKNTIKLVLIHLVCWAVFLSIPTIFNPRPLGTGVSKFVLDLLIPFRLANAIFLIAVFYFNTAVGIPCLYFRQKYLGLGASILVFFSCFYLINDTLQLPEFRTRPGFHSLGPSFNLFMLLMVYAMSFIICLYKQYQKVKEERLNARIAFLTAQINPHFLFNTLNSIYSLSLTKSDIAPDAIVKLSGIMRYSVTEGSQNNVALSQEVNYINNYIELQKLRLTDEAAVNLEITGEPGDIKVAPFLLIPFVENAFKHAVNGEDNTEIKIAIEIKDSLHMTVSNSKVTTRDRETGTGLGINTTRQRLELLYPGRHSLAINDETNTFTVSLRVDL